MAWRVDADGTLGDDVRRSGAVLNPGARPDENDDRQPNQNASCPTSASTLQPGELLVVK